jgi:hypothetical protein
MISNKAPLNDDTWSLLMKIVGDTGQNEGADDVIKRIAKFYLDCKPEEYQKRVGYKITKEPIGTEPIDIEPDDPSYEKS